MANQLGFIFKLSIRSDQTNSDAKQMAVNNTQRACYCVTGRQLTIVHCQTNRNLIQFSTSGGSMHNCCVIFFCDKSHTHHTQVHADMHACTHARMHTHMHTHMHARAHTHTHTHTHTLPGWPPSQSQCLQSLGDAWSLEVNGPRL